MVEAGSDDMAADGSGLLAGISVPTVAAAAMPLADPPGLATAGSSWLQTQDLAYAFEDEEANAEQAERNLRMREMLRLRRQSREPDAEKAKAPVPDEFMSIKASAVCGTSAPSKRSARAAAGGAGGDGPDAFWEAATAEAAAAPPPRRLDELPPWFVHRPHIENTVLRLHEELLDFAEFLSHSKAELAARRRWVKTIQATCLAIWPSCQVGVFGSFSTGLSLPNGDVDVVVLGVEDRPAEAQKMLADRLLANGEVSWLEIIEHAKVPVVKLREQVSGLRADVVFNQPNGLETSQFIKDRCGEYPQMRPLLIFLKYFLLQRGLHETFTGGMGSYLLCNVVLHFLQRHPSKKDPKHYAATSLGHLMFDFFKYYGTDFAYDTRGICVMEGGYTFNKWERQWIGGGRRGGDRGGVQLCLESPLQPGADLGGACFRMAVLKNLFSHALQCLSHLFLTRAGPDCSLLCPILLDPTHPVIRERHSLMAEQPLALPGLRRSSSRLDGEEEPGAADDEAPILGFPVPAGAAGVAAAGGTADEAAADGGAARPKKRRKR